MRAPGPSAGLVHHRDHDGRARRHGEDGSGRVPDQEPAAGSAERDVGARTCARAPRRSAGASGTRPATRRPARSRPAWACAICTWGGGGRGPAQAHCEIASDGSVDHAHRHAGHRHRHAHARRDGHRRIARPAAVAGQRRRSATRIYGVSARLGRQHDRRAASARRSASRRSRRSTRSRRRSRRRSASTPASLVAAGGRIHVKDNPSKGLSWADACKQIGPQPIAADGDWAAGHVVGRRPAACSSPKSTVDIETGIVKVTRDPRDPGLRPRRQPAHRREPVSTAASSAR